MDTNYKQRNDSEDMALRMQKIISYIARIQSLVESISSSEEEIFKILEKEDLEMEDIETLFTMNKFLATVEPLLSKYKELYYE